MSQLYSKDFPPDIPPSKPATGPTRSTSETPAPPVPGTPFPDNFFQEDPTGVYYGVGISVTYCCDRGLRGSPVAAPKDSQNCVFWRIHTGMQLKVVTWVMQRFGTGIPALPNVDTGDYNEVLLSDVISMSDPMDFPDGQQGITVVGQYVYLLQKSRAASDTLLIPNSNIRLNVLNQLVPANFLTNLIGPVTPPAGFSGGPISF